MPRRHAQGLRRHPRVPRTGGGSPNHCRPGKADRPQTPLPPWPKGRTDIKRLHVHGEKAAAYMADGYARASGKPGICAAQVIGALNLAAGLRDAWLAHSPVIAMTGGRDPKTKFRKVYQEIDDVPAF